MKKIKKFLCHTMKQMPECEKYKDKDKLLCICFSQEVRHLESGESFDYNPDSRQLIVRQMNEYDKYRLTERMVCICEATPIDIAEANDPEFNVSIIGHINDAGGYCCPHHGNTCGAHNW